MRFRGWVTASELAGLFALAQAGGFASQTAKIVQLGATNAAGANEVDVVDDRSIHGEDTLNTLSEAHLANRDGLTHPRVLAGNDNTFEYLKAFFFTFLNLYVDPDGVAGAELRKIGPLVLVKDSLQRRVLHLVYSLL